MSSETWSVFVAVRSEIYLIRTLDKANNILIRAKVRDLLPDHVYSGEKPLESRKPVLRPVRRKSAKACKPLGKKGEERPRLTLRASARDSLAINPRREAFSLTS